MRSAPTPAPAAAVGQTVSALVPSLVFPKLKKKRTKQTSNLLLAQPPPRYLSKHDAIVLQMGDRLMHGTKGVFPADVQGLTETTGVI